MSIHIQNYKTKGAAEAALQEAGLRDNYDVTEDPKHPGHFYATSTMRSSRLRDFPTHKGTVYLSGPIIGQTYHEARYGWRKTVADQLAPGITALSPMRHEGHLREIGVIDDGNLPDHFFSKSKIIVQKDKLDIQRSDIVLANFLGATRISKGTLVELGMAYAMDKTIITCMEDTGNVHDHFFVREPSLVLGSLEQAIEAINSLLSEGV